MGLGKLLHDHAEHAEEGGTIDHPRAYDVFASIGFAGRRREVFTRLAALSGVRPGHRILDVGCGTGYLTRILAPVVGPAGQVTGIDPAQTMIEYARRRAPKNCFYLVGDGQTMNLPDESFDVVVSSLAIHHMPVDARGSAVRQMFRVLRPGGRLLIAEFRPPTNPLAARLVGLLSGPAMRHSPRELLGDLIPEAGFQLVDDGTLKPFFYYVRAVRPQE
ncbi:methyltransferase domain-containing protein [Sphaerimonospora thailandensis]|uniref:Ubiquinone/menaquinone biosynthesis C-methyltransferase UbiE n=1 Tax=Sphaerimonospora thailandensis TaxID=795644 RepID=A0A8J3RED3_9ACTN|nr:methyltransferase domain-containing protein [Sphaerimonospora thailandensis]GIH73463.1 ubiquinone/menaquinone biosynthesis C-methyltransferase UbiE [Sphaerimonospora thailandensis]